MSVVQYRTRITEALTVFCLLAFTVVFCPRAYASQHKMPALTTVMYLVNRPSSITTFESHVGQISIIAPQVFSMDAEGFVMGEVPPEVMEIAARHHVAVMPLVTNRGFNQQLMHAVLDNARARERVIRYLLYYALRDGYIGFQFDYENIHYSYRDKFTRFVREAAYRFHQHALLLSVAVVGRYSDDRNADSPGGYDNWSGVYDYRELGRVADFLSIMAYPQHGGFSDPGPLAGLPWVQQIAAYSRTNIPPRSISLGVPLYGIQWTPVQSDSPTPASLGPDAMPAARKWVAHSMPYSSLAPILAANVPLWDDEQHAHHLIVSENKSEIWFEDADSVRPKLQLASASGFRGISGWVLGHEDPDFWRVLEQTYSIRHPRSHLRAGPFDQRSFSAARMLRH